MKKNKKIIIIIAVILVAFYLLNLFLNYYGDWLWFNNMQYGSVFNTMIIAKTISFILFFLVFILFFSTPHSHGSQERSSNHEDPVFSG